MAIAVGVETLARGSVTTWAGTTRVVAAKTGVREVALPAWQTETRPLALSVPEIVVETPSRGATDASAEAHLRQALRELAEYFAGERRAFTVALDPQGTPFFQAAWAEVARVPYGETRSYGEIARALRAPSATRAVGAANGANPVAPFVPCHRIVGSDGRLTGYGPGLPLKQRLLVMEDAVPASPDDYAAWTARVAARMGGEPVYIGLRGAGVYCTPACSRWPRQRMLPARVFGTAAEAEAAGFHACPACGCQAGA